MPIYFDTESSMVTYVGGGELETKHLGISAKTFLNEGSYGSLFVNKFDPSRLIKKSDSETLINEYTVGKKIDHPNFMKVYRLFQKVYVGKSGKPVRCKYKLEIERISGRTLGDIWSSEKIDRDFYLKLTDAICKGIIYLNHQKIAWDDVNPDNIMKTDDGEVKFIDFGFYVEETDDATRIRGSLKNYHNLVKSITKSYQINEDAEAINQYVEKVLGKIIQELDRGASPEQTLTSFLDSIKLYTHRQEQTLSRESYMI